MDKKLKKIYLSLLLPCAAGFALVYSAKMLGFLDVPVFRLHALVPPIVFIFSVIFAVAAPTLYRSYFAHKQRSQTRVNEKELTTMEARTIVLVMAAPYMALLAYGLNLPRFHLCGTVLMGLYALYYFYPSRKRLTLEKRMYRVEA